MGWPRTAGYPPRPRVRPEYRGGIGNPILSLVTVRFRPSRCPKRLLPWSEPIHRAPDAATAPIEDVGVDHCSVDVPMAQELLDRPDVVAILQQVGRKGVAEGVAADTLGNAGVGHRLLDRALQDRFVKVVPHPDGFPRVPVKARCREDVLPGPLEAGARILALERLREGHAARTNL
jgi:hypothetical protein